MATKGNWGFASMTPERLREIARMGGKEAHKKGTAHRWTKKEAIEAGKKGGQKVAANREHMRELGRLGGLARARKIREREAAKQAEYRSKSNLFKKSIIEQNENDDELKSFIRGGR